MTRNEFLEEVNDYYDLKRFCWDYDCYECDDIYDTDQLDDYINEQLVEWAHDARNWQELYDRLNEIDVGYDYYRIDGYGDITVLDDFDFDGYKDSVLEWGDRNGVWDEDEEEEEEVDGDYPNVEEEPCYASSSEKDPEPEDPVEDGCSLDELFSSGISQLQTIEIEEEAAAQEDSEAFKRFISITV